MPKNKIKSDKPKRSPKPKPRVSPHGEAAVLSEVAGPLTEPALDECDEDPQEDEADPETGT